MRKVIHEVAGDQFEQAASVADKKFVADQRPAAGSAVRPQGLTLSADGNRVTSAAPNGVPDLQSMLPTRPCREPNEKSSSQGSGDARHRDREVARGQEKPTPPVADETFLTDEELAARWNVSPKTLRNARVAGRLIGFVKIGRCVRYRLSEVIAYEAQNSVQSTSGGDK
jgi:hypothetical protein